jgi:uncharacterized delta-60 repeat protein/LPXTG-motif cell wall-anchored protein
VSHHSISFNVRRWVSSILLASSVVVGASALSTAPVGANFTPPPPCELGLPNSTGPITFDASFGSNGVRSQSLFSTNGIYLGANNSHIVASRESVSRNVANVLSRYLSNDTLDQTWGTSGQVRIDVNPSIPTSGEISENFQKSLTFPDGSLMVYVMAAKFGMYPEPTTDESEHLVKVTASGSLDNTFGTSGIKDMTNVSIGGQSLRIDTMHPGVAGPSGTFFFQARLNDGNYTRGIVKFTAAGALDTTFGQDGFVAVPFPSGFEMNMPSFDADGAGNVYVGTSNSNTSDAVVAKFSSNGVADQSFGTNGLLTVDTSSAPVEYVSQIEFIDGKLLASIVSGDTGWQGVKKVTAVIRLNTNGALDASFGTGGKATITGSSKVGVGTLRSFWPLPDGGMWIVSPADMMTPGSPVTFAKLSPDGASLTSWFSVKLGTCDNTNYLRDAVVTASGIYLLGVNSNNATSQENFAQVLNIFKIGLSGSSTPTTAPPTTTAPSTTTAPPTTTVAPSTTVASVTPAAATTTTLPAPALAVVRALPVATKPILADTSIATGEKVSVTFSGFRPFEFVQLIVASTPRVIGSGTANAQGVVTIQGNLPTNLGAGPHTLAVFAPASGIGFTQKITVSPATLPATGSNQMNLFVIAVLLFGVGLFLRQRTRTTATN